MSRSCSRGNCEGSMSFPVPCSCSLFPVPVPSSLFPLPSSLSDLDPHPEESHVRIRVIESPRAKAVRRFHAQQEIVAGVRSLNRFFLAGREIRFLPLAGDLDGHLISHRAVRSEERRVGKEWRWVWW